MGVLRDGGAGEIAAAFGEGGHGGHRNAAVLRAWSARCRLRYHLPSVTSLGMRSGPPMLKAYDSLSEDGLDDPRR